MAGAWHPPTGVNTIAAAFSSRTFLHPSLGLVSYDIQELSDDPDTQVAQTVDLLRRYVQQDANDAALQQDVQLATQTDEPILDTWQYLRRGGDRGMQFVRDEQTALPFSEYEYAVPGKWRPFVEAISRPEMLAKSSSPQGDCDCFCGYGASHLLIRGCPVSFCTVAADADVPQQYSHIYLVAYPQSGMYAGERVPLDLSHGPYPGWETQDIFRRTEWPLMGSGVSPCVIAAALLGAGAMWWYFQQRGGVN